MNAKPIIISILALALSSLAFAQIRGRYVNSKEGLNIRAEPNTRAEKVGEVNYGEFVEVAGEGEKASIDGIEARWAKIIINLNGLNLDDDYNTYGWVFGGMEAVERLPALQREMICLRFGIQGKSEHKDKEIAKMRGTSKEAVTQAVNRGLNNLRKMMADSSL